MLNNLTGGGWIIFFLAAYFDARLFVELIMVATGRFKGTVTVNVLGPALFTIWFIYLLS